MEPKLKVMIIEDSEDDCLLVVRELKRGGLRFEHQRVETAQSLKKALKDHDWDLILADFSLPGFTGLDALEIVKQYNLDCPFIIVSGAIGEEIAVQAMTAGVHDYIMKVNLKRLVPAIKRELREAGIRREHKKAEETLKKISDEWKTTFDAASDLIMLIDKNHTIKRVNRAVSGFLSLSYNEIIRKKCHDLFHGMKFPPEICPLAMMKRTGKHEKAEMFLPKKNMWILSSVSPILDDSGNLKGAVHIISDITERKNFNEQLRESEEKYRDLVEKAGIAILVDDEKGNITYTNTAARKIYGYSKEEMLQQSIRTLVYPDDVKRVFHSHIDRISGRKSQSRYIFRGIRKDTSIRYLELDVTPLEKGKRITGTRMYLRDITDRKKVEEELQRSREELRNLTAHLQSAIEKERTGIAREIHDELGQTLTVLKMDLSWMKKNIPQEEQSLHSKTCAMTELVDKTIQDVKRISSDLRPGLLDDLGIVPAIEWQAGEWEKRTGIQCRLSFQEKEIHLSAEASTVLYRIFQETLTNVARHAQASKVNISLGFKDENIWMKVEDNGRGITKSEIKNPKSLGLLGIKERASFLGGESFIQGKKNKGTTVIVKLPIVSENQGRK